jgi:hypothetical protein
MPSWSRAMLIAGALCALGLSLGLQAGAQTTASALWVSTDTAADSMRHVNAAFAAPSPTPDPPDPCSGRGWSFSHLLRFCGRIRVVPADAAERDLWWGEHLSELADAYLSAQGERVLFAPRQVVVDALVPSMRGAVPLALRGQPWTMASVRGFTSPAQAEANPFVRPFAAGGIGGYVLGFLSMDLGQSALAHLPGVFHLRGLSELSRRSILTEDLGEHIAGAQSWIPVLRESSRVSALTATCEALAAHSWTYDPSLGSVTLKPAPRRCATIWPR